MDNKGSKNLGKGLSAFFGDVASFQSVTADNPSMGDSKNSVVWIALSDINIDNDQPRKIFDEEKILELSESIKENGLIQPILLRYIEDGTGKKYKIVAGERRYRACKVLNLETIPAIIRTLSDKESRKISIIENVQRVDLSPIEESQSYNTLVREFNYSIEDIAKAIGKSKSHITNMIRLLKLDSYVQNALSDGKISIGHARPLIGLDNQSEICDKIISENLSVRQVEKFINEKKRTAINESDDESKSEDQIYKAMGKVISAIVEDEVGGYIDANLIKVISDMVYNEFNVDISFEKSEGKKEICSFVDPDIFGKIVLYIASKMQEFSKKKV